jgi:hypothetical protein
MLTVACVKWGERYTASWVLRLRTMVRRHLSPPHRFVCLTEAPVAGVECIPLAEGLTTWWSKLSLFRPGQFTGPVLYFDLDVVLTASIDRIVSIAEADKSRLWMRDDFSYSLRSPRSGLDVAMRRMLGGAGCCNSSVMAWRADAARDVWDKFTPDVMDELHGDQNHISRVMWPDKLGFLPDDLVGSFKYGTTAPVTVFHGSPKMDELPPSHKLRKLWEAA